MVSSVQLLLSVTRGLFRLDDSIPIIPNPDNMSINVFLNYFRNYQNRREMVLNRSV